MSAGQPYSEPAVAAPANDPLVPAQYDPHAIQPKVDEKHLEGGDPHSTLDRGHLVVDTAGAAVIEQRSVIPKTGRRMPTSRWEYWLFCLYCEPHYSRKEAFGYG